MSWPLKNIFPPDGSIDLIKQRPKVDFPQPDSPTRPKVSPFLSSNETFCTALTAATCLEKIPPWIGKCFTIFSAFNKISDIVTHLQIRD